MLRICASPASNAGGSTFGRLAGKAIWQLGVTRSWDGTPAGTLSSAKSFAAGETSSCLSIRTISSDSEGADEVRWPISVDARGGGNANGARDRVRWKKRRTA